MTTESESEIMRNANRHVLFLLLFIIPFTPERAMRQDLSFYALFPGLPETEHSGLIPPTGNVLFSGNAVTDEKRPVKGFFGSGPEKVAFAVVRFRTNRIITVTIIIYGHRIVKPLSVFFHLFRFVLTCFRSEKGRKKDRKRAEKEKPVRNCRNKKREVPVRAERLPARGAGSGEKRKRGGTEDFSKFLR